MKRLAALVMAGPILLLGSAAMAETVNICHVPPGNAGNAHTISVSQSAVAAHLAHGDTLGACECRVDDDCTDGNLCDEDHCERGKCQHVPLSCPAQPCVENPVCVPETGECAGTPVDCGDGVCDPSAGGCVPCDLRQSAFVNHPSVECPNSSECLQCCDEATEPIHPGFFDSCSTVIAVIDDFPNFCACLGCHCVGP